MDLRERVVAAGDHGDATRQQIAEGFIRRLDGGAIAGLTSRIVSRARRKTKGDSSGVPAPPPHSLVYTHHRANCHAHASFSSKALSCGGKIGERGAHVRVARPVTARPWSSVPPLSERALCANRQLIVELFPTVHRGAFIASDRQLIVEIGGGGDRCSQRSGARSLSFLRSLRLCVGADGYAGNIINWRGRHALLCPTTGLGRHSPAMVPRGGAGWNRYQPASKASVPANIHGGDVVAEE